MGSLLMHTLFLFLTLFFFGLLCFLFLFSPFIACSTSTSFHDDDDSFPSLFVATTFYTVCHDRIYHFYPSTAFGSLWASFQDCPLVCWLPSHYHCTVLVAPLIISRQNGLSYFLPLFVFTTLIRIRVKPLIHLPP